MKRIYSFLAAVVCGMLLMSAAATMLPHRASSGVQGDVNGDNGVDIEDMNICINVILGNNTNPEIKALADITGEGSVDISDVNAIINIILTGPAEPVTTTYTVKGVSFTMVKVDGGTFTMGTPVVADGEQDDAKSDERPTHQVTLSSYNIGVTEVTQELWQAVMGSNPSNFNSENGYGVNLQRPVEQVSWSECKTFITKLNRLTGKTFRLPTEAEWEYAARGGKKSQGYKFAGSNNPGEVSWYSNNSGSQTHAVATKAPNELGLYDMSGNVNEWCSDWYGDYGSEPQTNPTGPASGLYRVYRGGSWLLSEKNCRVSARDWRGPDSQSTAIGLRLAM